MNDKLKTGSNKTILLVAVAMAVVSFVIYFFTTNGQPTQFNNFVLLADAILNGRLHLYENLTWIELAHYNGRYFIVPPPVPAILILPVVAITGLDTNQTLLSYLFGSINVSLAFLAARCITRSIKVQIWTAVMFGFGTIHWWVAANGGVWMFSHVISVTFLFIAIILSFKKAHPLLPGLSLGAAYWTRLPTILGFPFFMAMYLDEWYKRGSTKSIIRKINLKPLVYMGFGAGIFVVFNAIYNYARFDTPFDVSYYLIPGILEEYWYAEGIFDLSYIPRHLKIIFGRLPNFSNEFPYITPSWNGLAIWITTPAFIYAFFAGIRNRIAIGCWLSIVLIALVDFCHGTWGFTQFGYRFALDFYPFLFLLTVKGIGDKIRWYHITLIVIGIIVNLWGVLWTYKFGWVGF
jgi:hypothetical protein